MTEKVLQSAVDRGFVQPDLSSANIMGAFQGDKGMPQVRKGENQMTNTELREKLVELIRHSGVSFANYPITDVIEEAQRNLADHLIANGVTFAKDTEVPTKWISASEPPKDWKGEGGYLTNYYVYTPEYGTDIGNYMGAADRWLCMGIPCNVTHWMPLPEPPKGDEA